MFPQLSLGIDRGGTFTDIYCEVQHESSLESHTMKLLSEDPKNYKDAPTEGIRRLLSQALGSEIPRDEKIPS